MIDESGQRLRLTLRQLEVFAATARAGSTRAAAARVARSQSATSAALTELETALGVFLFDRVGRRLALNENGRALLPAAAALLDQAGELQGLFDAAHPAPLRVAASLTIGEYLLPEHIARWKSAHPASPVRMAIGNTTAVIAAVVALDADVGFIEGPQTHNDLQVHDWLRDELVVVAAAGHRWSSRRPRADQLRLSPWILRELGSGTRQAADRWLLAHLGAVNVAFELGSTEAVKRLAAAGAGLALLSRHAVADNLAQGSLVELRTGLPPATRQLALVVRRDRRLGRTAEDFIAHCLQAATRGARGRSGA